MVRAKSDENAAASEATASEVRRPAPDRSASTQADPGEPDPAGIEAQADPWSLFRLPVTSATRYVIESEVARGGIGRVLVAHDTQLDRRVAIKEPLRAGARGDERFVREALLTARLEHPSIVPVYDAGRLPTGRPYYSMKLVAGRALSELLAAPADLDARLLILPSILSVVEAMAYAHDKRVIHRDLKPSNILFGPFGEAVVIDWGLAKRLDDVDASLPAEAGPRAAALTLAGAIVGTPTYMSPEQAAGEPVDERTDVYALGAILYCVIAGRPPYEGEDAGAVVDQVRAGPPPALASLVPGAAPELCAVVEKAMHRDLGQRYRSARELGEDLRRLLAGALVGAHRYTLGDIVARFLRRHRVAVTVAAVAFAVLAVAGGASLQVIVAARRKAEAGEQLAVAAERRATERSDQLLLSQASSAIERDPTDALLLLASLSPAATIGGSVRMLAADAREHGIWPVLRGHTGLVNGVVFSPDGRSLGSFSDDHSARLWDPRTGQARVLEGHRDEVWGMAFSADGARVATAGKDATLRVWDTGTGALVHTFASSQPLSKVTFLASGERLAAIGEERALRVWELATGASTVLAEQRLKVVFAADRRHALTVGLTGEISVHDLLSLGTVDGPPSLRVLTDRKRLGPGVAACLSDDGGLVVAGGEDGAVRLWSVATGEVKELRGHGSHIDRVALSPDEREVASTSRDGTLRIWDRKTGAALQVLEGHDTLTTALRYSPDGRFLASSGVDRVVHLWEQGAWTRRVLRGSRGGVAQIAFSPASSELAAGCNDGAVRLVHLRDAPSHTLGHRRAAQLAVDVDAAGERVVTGGADGEIWSFPVEGGAPVRLGAHRAAVTQIVFDPAGKTLASVSEDGSLQLFDARRPTGFGLVPEGSAQAIAFSPDGLTLLSGDGTGAVRLFVVASGESRELGRQPSAIRKVAFSPDGRVVAAGASDGVVRVWSLPGGESRELGRHARAISALCFAPDGRSLLAGSEDHVLLRWSLTSESPGRIEVSGNEVAQILPVPGGHRIVVGSGGSALRVFSMDGVMERALLGHEARITAAAVAPDGRRAVSASEDRTLRLWDLQTGENRVLGGHGGAVRDVRFSRDGRWLVSVGDDGRVRRWADDLPWEAERLRTWIEAAGRGP